MDRLVALYAIVDTAYWPVDKLRTWASEQERCAASPDLWMVELAYVSSLEEAEQLVYGAVRDEQLSLRGISAIELGLLYSKWVEGRASWAAVRMELFDVADAAGEESIVILLSDNKDSSQPTDRVRSELQPLCESAVREVTTALSGPYPTSKA